jgi:ribulose-5-phosphate 4-epimerase/fuculose-1-phosphate aldolase
MTETMEATREDRHLLDHYREMGATSCRILAQHGLVSGSTGHVSRRIPGSADILVRGRPHVDRGLRFAEPDSIIRVDADARPVGDTHGVARVSEIYLHTEVYKRRPEVNAVIHAHPPASLLCTINNVPLRPIFGGFNPGGMRMAIEGVPIYERTITLHTLEETNPMLDLMGNKNVILLARHGILVSGRSVGEATSRAIQLELHARLNWLANLQGDPGEVPEIDRQEFARRAQRDPVDGRNAMHPGGFADRSDEGGSWAYLTTLLEAGPMFLEPPGGFRF